MSDEKIAFIGISFLELSHEPVEKLIPLIENNLKPFYQVIPTMDTNDLTKLREDIKNTRKEKFRFSQEITKEIPKDRIQIALSQLAQLFRLVDDEIKKKAS